MNFIFAKKEGVSGESLYKTLRDAGILVRHFNKPRINDFIRITVGTKEQMDALIEVLERI
jgi:histidinol-phosphate aminotransferase